MIPRFEELKREATTGRYEMGYMLESGAWHYDFSLEKFAQLIVKDVINEVAKADLEAAGGDTRQMRSKLYEAVLKKYT